jgi:hypothetical protein
MCHIGIINDDGMTTARRKAKLEIHRSFRRIDLKQAA